MVLLSLVVLAVEEKESSASDRSSHPRQGLQRWGSQLPHSFAVSRTGRLEFDALPCRCGIVQAAPLPDAVTASGITKYFFKLVHFVPS